MYNHQDPDDIRKIFEHFREASDEDAQIEPDPAAEAELSSDTYVDQPLSDNFDSDASVSRLCQQFPPLDPATEFENIKLAQAGNISAKSLLVRHNIKLIYSCAHPYRKQVRLGDLIQAGNLGLLRAIARFDLSKNVKFSSYANPAIRGAMCDCIEEKRAIRLPVNQLVRLRKVAKFVESHLKADGRPPTLEEISANTGFSLEVLAELFELARRRMVSLNLTPDGEHEIEGKETVAKESFQPEFVIERRELRRNIQLMLSVLSEKERLVVVLRFGLEKSKPLSLRQVGDRLHISKQAVRKIQIRALSILKQHKIMSSYDPSDARSQ